MKVVAYSIKSFEKEFLAKANQKKHDITLISNPLSPETTRYAEGKDAVVVLPMMTYQGRLLNNWPHWASNTLQPAQPVPTI